MKLLGDKKSVLILCISLLVIISSADPNPGYVIAVREQIFTDLIQRYFQPILDKFGHFHIPAISASGINITDVFGNITNPSASNVIFNFNQTGKSLDIGMVNTTVSAGFNWKYSTLSGSANITGPVKTSEISLLFDSAVKNQFKIPQVNLKQFLFALDKNSFKIHLDCSSCPQVIIDLLVKMFKTILLDSIEKIMDTIVNQKIFDEMNKVIFTLYPTTLNITKDIGICLATTNTIAISDDHIEVPLDLTMYLTSEGYSRQGDGPVIPTYDVKLPGEIMFFLSSYVTDSAMRLFNKIPLSFPFTLWSIPMTLDILGPAAPTSIKILQNNFEIIATPTLSIDSLKTKITIEIETSVDASVKAGDNTYLLYFTPQLKKVSLNKIIVDFLGYKLDLSMLNFAFNWVAKQIINHIFIPTIPIPQIPGFKLKMSDSILQVQNDYVEFGVSFDFESMRKSF